MTNVWRAILDKVKPYVPGKPIGEVKRELGLDTVIKLASNENPLQPDEKMIEAISAAARSVNRYPDGGCFYLRKALSEKLNVPGGNLIFGNGSDEIILICLHAFLEAGDKVIVADPTFLIYHIASMIKGGEVVKIPLKNFKYDLDAMLEAVDERTKVIFLANPDNPTGSYVTGDELDTFIGKLPKDIVVFLDEAYYEFAKGGDYPETIKYTRIKDRTIIVARTFSKAYGLAGLRIGYGIARKEVSEVLNKVREPFNVNSLAQAAALAALECDDFVVKSVDLVASEKDRLYGFFTEMDLEYIPSKTNFILINTKRDSTAVFDYLLKKGVIVREMSGWGLDGFIRVNIGLPEENSKFLEVLSEALSGIPTK